MFDYKNFFTKGKNKRHLKTIFEIIISGITLA